MYKHSFLDYLELIENCRNSEDELFFLNTEVELRNFRKNGSTIGKVADRFVVPQDLWNTERIT